MARRGSINAEMFLLRCRATVIEGQSHSFGMDEFFLPLPDGYQPINQYLQLYIPNAVLKRQ